MLRKLLFAGLIIGILAPSAAFAGPVRPSMTGASPAPEGAYPFAVRVDGLEEGDGTTAPAYAGFCSGSLISPDYVLTAAHCVQGDIGDYPELLTDGAVRVSFLNAPGVAPIKVVRAAYYKAFRQENFGSSSTSPDLAVLQLAEPASVTPVQLGPLASPAIGPFRELGYGALTEEQQDYGKMQDRLYQGDMQVPMNSRRCLSDVKSSEGRISDAFEICTVADRASNALASACNGDSGGPLLGPDGVQVGVTSWAQYLECETPVSHRSTIFARVSAGTDWLRRQTGAPLFGLPALPQDSSAPQGVGVDLSRPSRRSVSAAASAEGSDWQAKLDVRIVSRRKGKTRSIIRRLDLSSASPARSISIPRSFRRPRSRLSARVVYNRFFNSLMNGTTLGAADSLSWRS